MRLVLLIAVVLVATVGMAQTQQVQHVTISIDPIAVIGIDGGAETTVVVRASSEAATPAQSTLRWTIVPRVEWRLMASATGPVAVHIGTGPQSTRAVLATAELVLGQVPQTIASFDGGDCGSCTVSYRPVSSEHEVTVSYTVTDQ